MLTKIFFTTGADIKASFIAVKPILDTVGLLFKLYDLCSVNGNKKITEGLLVIFSKMETKKNPTNFFLIY